MFFSKFFKKKYPYAPIAYLGRKTVERTLDANIRKLKKVEKEIGEEQLHKQESTDAEENKAEKKNAESNKALNKKVDTKKNQKKAVDQTKKSVEKSKSKVSTKSKK